MGRSLACDGVEFVIDRLLQTHGRRRCAQLLETSSVVVNPVTRHGLPLMTIPVA
jgi:hypothetical protein